MKKIITLLAFLPLLAACDDLFEPALENNRDIEAMYQDPSYAQGILANAYIKLPYATSPNSDLATDDAVTNENTNNYLRMATGSWSASNDPTSRWQDCYFCIQFINIFLENVDKVEWAADERVQTMFRDRLTGEAYGLRAVFMYYLLQAHGGYTEDGKLMGVPILLSSEDPDSDFNHERATYAACVEQIIKDADKAIELLPLDYVDLKNNADVPQKYQEIGVTEASTYNRVNGINMGGLMTARIAMAVKAQVALMAASPAFSAESGITWKQAAEYAGDLLDKMDNPWTLDADGNTWYDNAEITNLVSGANPEEIIWRGSTADELTLEQNNFPPSLYGNGRVNPSQNLVDAFPMANGYPISHSKSNYDEDKPYEDRDPRLTDYILYNGSAKLNNGTAIDLAASNNYNANATNTENGRSTRTGYYLLKLLRPGCNPNPQYNTAQRHYSARIRYTEIFLAYAEAANEAYGPMGTGKYPYSAKDIIKKIRQRAGINDEGYLNECAGDPDKMRELIRNERRLELCFENFRFWDLRRWKVDMEKLNETIRGVKITDNGNDSFTYEELKVEIRNYSDYMYYGPIPHSEILKWSNLKQNKGW